MTANDLWPLRGCPADIAPRDFETRTEPWVSYSTTMEVWLQESETHGMDRLDPDMDELK
ncbi:hypothetical protein [Streptomyces sp. NRRL B-1347]|uniref:hypothetical protein n=1 Tax=Streptomyces sp. NRRL B-1347 TaxID=1476877 RepID=UPI00131CAFD9|nr:hypothetical protein [Streptomyces sp. NRRL B-1347]